MSDEKPIGVRVQRPYATREEYLDAEADLLGRSQLTLVGTKPRAPGTLLRFEIVLLSGEPVIRAEGRVVGPREFGAEAGLQVKLTRIDNRTKAILEEAAQRKTAHGSPARNSSQANTASPPPAAAPLPLPVPEERRSGEDVAAAATHELAAMLEPEPEPEPAPDRVLTGALAPGSDPAAPRSEGGIVSGPHDRDALLARLRSRRSSRA